MPSLTQLDNLYMDIAFRIALMSRAQRAKVGAVLTRDDNILSYGWNGTPSGDDNSCEDVQPDGSLVTRQEVLHSESNCLMKLAAHGGQGAAGATLYVTMSPCKECAKLIKQAKISRVVYRDAYRDTGGVEFLRQRGVEVDQLGAVQPAQPVVQPVVQPAQPVVQPAFIEPSAEELAAMIAQATGAAPSPTQHPSAPSSGGYVSSFF